MNEKNNEADRPKKATFYIKKPTFLTELKYLAIKTNRDQSGPVTEAIEDLIKKYS